MPISNESEMDCLAANSGLQDGIGILPLDLCLPRSGSDEQVLSNRRQACF